jgi:eukaryotic-like serine/threonine-protein kinase
MIGEQLGGLKIVAELGAGGMGTVYLAEHAVLKDKRAIKLLNPQFTKIGPIVARFVDEARATAALRHRNLVRVFDIGQLPDSGPWYTVMEYLEGGTLLRFMASQGGPIAAHLIVHILAQVLCCMHWVHGNGVVHRDLKPENIFLIQDGDNPHFVKVLDLGVAQMSEDFASGPRTKTGTVIGTPIYMAPEALRGQRVTRAADVFAVGVIAYEMATGGWFPWQREESRAEYFELAPAELCHRQLTSPPLDPRLRVADIRAELAEAILALIDADPTQRPDDRAAALRLAEATPTDGVNPDGLAVLREVAADLMKSDNLLETIRSHRSLFETPSSPTDARYQLGQKLGTGGMAEVFLGTRLGAEGFERRVAIKRVLAGYSDDPAFEQMFTAEARLLCQLNHPNIVAVVDFSRDADRRLFLVMEYVDGRDLAALSATGSLPPSAVIYVIAEILRGLGYAHNLPDPSSGGRGLVHRDVTPRNVLLSYEGEVKVADFGLARMRDASGKVRSDVVRGTPSYMSPEQCRGQPLDGRSDLCAVGAILWELLAGQPMYSGTPHEVVGQVLFKELQRPSAVTQGRVPPDLEMIAIRLLARNRDERYPTAQVALDDLMRCGDAPRDGRGELARLLAERFPTPATRARDSGGAIAGERGRAAAQITAAAPPSTFASEASQTASVPSSRLRWGMLVGLGSLLVAILSVGVLVAGRDDSRAVTIAPDSSQYGTSDAAVARAPAIDARPVAPDGRIVAAPVLDGRPDAAIVTHIDAAVVIAAVPADASGPRLAAADAAVPAEASVLATKPPPPPSSPVAQAQGELVVLVKPWATLWLDGKQVGETPQRVAVPAGRHSVRLVNEERGKNEWATVTITPGRTTTIERNW